MNILDSLKEHVKELYPNSIGKFVLPVALASTLTFTSACGPSAPPTPVPTPTQNPILSNLTCYESGRPVNNLRLHSINPLKCYKDGKLALRFELAKQIPIGQTLEIPIFISRDVSDTETIPVRYSKLEVVYRSPSDYGDVINTQMSTLANIPAEKDIVLKFRPESGGVYAFFLPGVKFLDWDVRSPGIRNREFVAENNGKAGEVCVGIPVNISIGSDEKEVAPYTSVLISGSSSGVDYFRVEITKDNKFMTSFNIENSSRSYSVNWLPENPGTYKITTVGYYGCFMSVSNPLTIVVK